MIRAMYSGVSGMAAHQTKLNVIGNNIANVNTYGFKSSRVVFSDVLYQNIKGAAAAGVGVGGANASQIGYGVKVASIDLNNTITGGSDTGRGLDVYINGEGFFPIKLTDGSIKYTRVGNLKFDTQGNLTDGAGNLVLGSNVNGDPTLEVNADIAQDRLNAAQKALAEAQAASKTANEALTKAAKNDATALAKVTTAETALAAAQKSVEAAEAAVVKAHGEITTSLGKLYTAGPPETGSLPDLSAAITKLFDTATPPKPPTALTDAIAVLQGTEGNVLSGLKAEEEAYAKDPSQINLEALEGKREAYNEAIKNLNDEINKLTVEQRGELEKVTTALKTEQALTAKAQANLTAAGKTVQPAKDKKNTAEIDLNGSTIPPVVVGAKKEYANGKTAEKKAQAQLEADTKNAIQIDAANTVATATEELNKAQTDADAQRTSQPSLDGDLMQVTQLQSIRVDPATLNACTGISIGKGGDITGIKNGRPIILGTLSVAKFVNPEGLNQDGDGYYQVSANSGPAEVTRPGTNATGGIESSQLEMSNVDLSKEFTEMIVAQRGFQANTRIVTVSDQILEELINLKR